MPADEKRKNLGRGLSALLGEDSQDYAQLDKLRVSKLVPIEFIRPGRYQPRHKIDEEPVKELAQSIAEKGILQPILVRRDSGQPNTYEIIAGERRWRAAQLAGLHEVPVIVKDLSDSEALEIALVENLQRQDLSPLEEAEGYRRLMEEFAHTQEQLAKTVGKSRSHVANMMRLLGLPEPVKQFLEAGQLTAGHARALLNAPNPIDLAKQIVQRGLNVRQAEVLAQAKPGKPKAAAAAPKKDADTLALERDLATLLGLKVEIKFHGKEGGVLAIHYGSLDQLDDILQRLSHGGTAGGAHRTLQTAPPGKPEQAFEVAAMASESPKAAPAAKPAAAKKPAAPPRKVAVAVKATEPKATKSVQAKPAEKKNNNR
jgi:ParB family chromosome partitioning protein